MINSQTPSTSADVRDWRAILCLVVFLITNIIVIFPIRIPIPFTQFKRKRNIRFPLDFSTAPVPAVLFLLATTSINGTVVRKGILGADGIKPIDIMALFISLAYIAISLDATGLLRFLAFWLVSKSAGGKKMYLYLYLLFFGSGVVVGNDPVILSGTAFLAYMTRVAGIVPPTAWIFAQFSAANIASTVLVSSNPTNLVLTGAFSISFVTYSLNVLLPAIASAILLFPFLLYVQFRSRTLIPSSIHVAGLENPTAALVDKPGAIFGTALLTVTLVVLLGMSASGLHVEVWSITAPAAVVMLIRDIWHDISISKRLKRENSAVGSQSANTGVGPDGGSDASLPMPSGDGAPTSHVRSDDQTIELRRLGTSLTNNSRLGLDLQSSTRPRVTARQLLRQAETAFPTAITVSKRLPWALLPFAFSMFILVQALGSVWIDVFANWWSAWATRTGIVGVVFGSYTVTVLACNFCGTNIGATILLARVFQIWISVHSPSSRTAKGAIYGLALGSNYGAFSASFSASLAGLLWKNILEQKGIKVRQLQFMKINLGLNLVAMVAGCSVLVAQLYVRG